MKWPSHHRGGVLCALGAALLASALPVPAWGDRLQAQYRIDGAIPQALPLVGSDSSRTQYWEGNFALNVSAANLSVGPHYLEVRMAGTNGVWCEWQGQWFRVSGPVTLTAAEWFVDTDPGLGLGKPIPLPADGAWNEAEEDLLVSGVTVTNLPTGRHTLFVRCQDSSGDWGLTNSTVFYVAAELSIVAAEWTANPNANAGSGFPMQLTATTNTLTGEVSLEATNTTLAVGTNYCAVYPLFVRVQDSLGRWSTREGWYLDAARTNWLFDANAGWANGTASLVVSPEVPSAPVLCDDCLTNNGALKLSWKTCQGVTGYQVFGRSTITQPFSLWASGTNNWFLPGTLTNGTYAWIVRSWGGNECYKDSPVWQFTVTSPRGDDTDNDGIPDAWERQYFGQLFRANGTTDWDGDGVKDWQEHVLGTAATNRLDYFKIAGCRAVPSGVAVDFPTTAGRTYTVYYAMDMAGLSTTWFLFDQVTGTGSTMSLTNTWPDPQGYFLISVTAP
jgi:hypothetical protein